MTIIILVLLGCDVSGCAGPGTDDDALAGGQTFTGDDTAALTPEAFIAGQQLTDDDTEGLGDDVTCHWERPLGSHIKKRVCTTEAERQKAAIEARHLVKTREARSPN
jgi:hypothetical protein